MIYKSTLTHMVNFNVTGFWEVEVNDKTFDAEKFTFVFCKGDHSSFDIKTAKRVSPEELKAEIPEWDCQYTLKEIRDTAYVESKHKAATEKYNNFKKDLKKLLAKYDYTMSVGYNIYDDDAEVTVNDNAFFEEFQLAFSSGNDVEIEL